MDYKVEASEAIRRDKRADAGDRALIGDLASGNWNAVVTPLGLAREVLRHYPDKFLIVNAEPQGRALLAHEGGTWIDGDTVFRATLDELGRRYLEAMDRIVARLPAENKAERALYREKIRLWRAATIKYAQPSRKLELEPRFADALDYIEASPMQCPESALADNLEWIGAPNGVVNLRTGEHIDDASESRGKLVVGMLPDPFDWSATSPLIGKLFAHVDDVVKRYMLQSLAWSLRGKPSRVFMLLLGPGGGGKSTLAAALQEALGIYASTVSEDAFTKKRNTSGLAPSISNLIAPKRLAFLPEANKSLYDPERLKAISGADRVTWRPLYRSERTDQVTATVLMAANHLPRLDGTDQALMDRMRVLPYPPVPALERDVDMINAFAGNSEIAIRARQSLIVAIVAAGMGLSEPPTPPPAVIEATQDALNDLIGEAGLWIRENVIEQAGGQLSTTGLWQALQAAFETEDKVVGGLTRQGAVKLVSSLYGKTRHVRDPRRGGKAGRGWKDVGLC